jgi:RNA polymerase sigma factor (sigma-70 family)
MMEKSLTTPALLSSDDGDATDRLLVERHQPFVYNVAIKMFGRHEDAQELSQEVFVKVITSLKTFDTTARFARGYIA